MAIVSQIIGSIVMGLCLSFGPSCATHIPAPENYTLIAVGDVMLGRGVKPENAFKNVHDFFMSADSVFVNLEGVISPNYKYHLDIHEYPPVLLFKPEIADILAANNVHIASVANNHGRDAKIAGLENTRKILKEKGILPAGDPKSITGDHIVEQDIGDQTIVWIALNLINNSVNQKEIADLISLHAAKPNTIVFVSVHWGIEYTKNPDRIQKKFARIFIDSGADVVIGHHPHVVQPVETYKGKPIFYSLGNFVFDQIPEETRIGRAVQFSISPKGEITYEIFPVKIENRAPKIIEPKKITRIGELQLGFLATPFVPGKFQKRAPLSLTLQGTK